jgi:hypothetical protein
MPQPSRHWDSGDGMWFPRSPHSAADFMPWSLTMPGFIPWSLTMPGVITPVKPVSRKPSEPDPRLARMSVIRVFETREAVI